MPAKTSAPISRRAREKSVTILDVAVRSFLANGYSRTSVDSIAAEAGVGKQTVYSYFDTKEGLFLAAVVHAREAQRATLVETSVDPAVPAAGLSALARVCLKVILDPTVSALRRLTIGEMPHHSGLQELWRESAAPAQPYPQVIEFLEACDKRGTLVVTDPHRSARQFVFLLATEARTVTAQGIEPLPARERDRIVADTVDLFVRAHRP